MILARTGGYEIAREGHLVEFRVRAGGGLVIVIAGVVAGALAVMAWAMTLWSLWLALGDTGPGFQEVATPVKLAVGLTITSVALLLGRNRGRDTRAPPFMVADLQRRLLLDAQGNLIVPLDQCRAVKTMLITSSAPSLQLRWAGGKREVFRGSLFGGGVADVLSRLHQLGFRS